MITVEPLTGEAITAALPALARLRIAVFREWPYLYDGTLDHEEGYLARFAAAKSSVIVAAREGEEIVGVATASPLIGAADRFIPAFRAHGFDPDKVFYFGESVLLPPYRGRGLGHAFFDAREVHARAARGGRLPDGESPREGKNNYTHAAFCGVVRSSDHPRRPADYRPLDAFWEKRGYAKIAGLLGSFDWKDLDDAEETAKPMQFWLRAL